MTEERPYENENVAVLEFPEREPYFNGNRELDVNLYELRAAREKTCAPGWERDVDP